MPTMVDEILSQLSAEDLAAQLGTDPDTAMDAVRKALPALLGGLSSNVSSGGGDALGAALERDHDGSLLDRSDLLGGIDPTDGQKIVGHIFGDRQDQVVDKLGATSRAGSSLFSKLLPLLAPLVMAWLAKKVIGSFTGGGAAQQAASIAAQGAAQPSGGGLGGLLGGLFGSGGGNETAPAPSPQTLGQPSAASGASGGGLGGLLGGLFSGGGQAQDTGLAGTAAAAPQTLGQQQSGGLGGGLGGLLGGLLGREVEQEKSAMPDLGDLFDLLGGGSQPDAGNR